MGNDAVLAHHDEVGVEFHAFFLHRNIFEHLRYSLDVLLSLLGGCLLLWRRTLGPRLQFRIELVNCFLHANFELIAHPQLDFLVDLNILLLQETVLLLGPKNLDKRNDLAHEVHCVIQLAKIELALFASLTILGALNLIEGAPDHLAAGSQLYDLGQGIHSVLSELLAHLQRLGRFIHDLCQFIGLRQVRVSGLREL